MIFVFLVNQSSITMKWRLPIIDDELASKLRSVKLILVSKKTNSASTPLLQLVKIENSSSTMPMRSFRLPSQPSYISLNVKRLFRNLRGHEVEVRLQVKRPKNYPAIKYLINAESHNVQPFLLIEFEKCSNKRNSVKVERVRKRLERRRIALGFSDYAEQKYLGDIFGQVKTNHTKSKRDAFAKCDVRKAVIDVDNLELGLDQKILLPTKISLNQCLGSCSSTYLLDSDLDMSNHARFKQLLTRYRIIWFVNMISHTFLPRKSGKQSWKTSCVPVDYEARSILLLTEDHNVVLMKVDSLVAKSCGCRWQNESNIYFAMESCVIVSSEIPLYADAESAYAINKQKQRKFDFDRSLENPVLSFRFYFQLHHDHCCSWL